MQKILIIEDDSLAAELERDYLEAAGFAVDLCGNGTEGLAMVRSGGYALILLDVMLPGMNGFEVCREIRKEKNVPIILITARTEDVDKVRGLGLGADDYIVKPFNPTEMTARVQAHIRIHERLLRDMKEQMEEGGSQAGQSEEIVCGDLVIATPYRKVTVRGREIALKNREYELLVFLASHPGIVFTKDTLLDRIWGMDATQDTATVTVHVNRIREKIEQDPQNPEFIRTVWGAGYKFKDQGSV